MGKGLSLATIRDSPDTDRHTQIENKRAFYPTCFDFCLSTLPYFVNGGGDVAVQLTYRIEDPDSYDGSDNNAYSARVRSSL